MAMERLKKTSSLIAWMSPDRALRRMKSSVTGLDCDLNETIKNAILYAQKRRKYKKLKNAITLPPTKLRKYITQLELAPHFQVYKESGWVIRMANLKNILAIQTAVNIDDAYQKVADLKDFDIVKIAEITIPLESGNKSFKVEYDAKSDRWLFISDSPNLHIVGHFQEDVQLSENHLTNGYGIAVEVLSSFVQVVSHRGRLILRDGYHRSVGLLAAGISHVPVLYREFGEFEDLGLDPSNFGAAVYHSETPPTLADYLDKRVSIETTYQPSKTIISFQATKFSIDM